MTTNIEPITIAIDDGPVTPDFDGRSRGWQASLIVDPRQRRVTLYTSIGGGVPASVWHNREYQLGVSSSASGRNVREILESERGQELLSEILDCYEGEHWDGHNRVGAWRHDDGLLACEDAAQALGLMLEDVQTYWSASEWLACDWEGCRSEVEAIVMSAENDGAEREALTAYAEMLVDEGEAQGALVDIDDVERQVDLLVQELEEGDLALWLVTAPSRAGLQASAHEISSDDEHDAIEGLGNLGSTWWLVEATSSLDAWRKARALRSQGASSGRDEP